MLISSTKKLLKELFTLSKCSNRLLQDSRKQTGPLIASNQTESRRISLAASFFSVLAIILLSFQATRAQDSKTVSSPHTPAIELPVTLRQNVTAGKTPPGTKIQARLTIATLVNGVVIPEGATLSGEVTESVARSPAQSTPESEATPSRLSIRLDSAQWKAHPAPLDLSPHPYLTEWFYPPIPIQLHDHDHDHASDPGIPNPGHSPGFGTGGTYPGQRNPTGPPISPPSPSDTSTTEPRPPRPNSDDSQHREPMKGVESSRSSDGALTLSSKTLNIKLDKNITYVFASDQSGPSGPSLSH